MLETRILKNSNNIAAAWIDHAKESDKTITEQVKFMNTVCGTKMQAGSIYSMRNGTKNIPTEVMRFMINEVLLIELKRAGLNSKKIDFKQLRDRLSPPKRA